MSVGGPIARHVEVLVLGAGAAGLAASNRLRVHGVDHLVLEQGSSVGGAASSFSVRGCRFDNGIHGLYTQDSGLEAELTKSCPSPVDPVDVSVVATYNGNIAPHPAQYSFESLAPEAAPDIRTGLLAAAARFPPCDNKSYADWSRRAYGSPFADTLLLPYTRKFWATDPADLTADWMGRRAVRYTAAEVEALRGGERLAARHYVKRILYPRFGGFGALLAGYATDAPVITQEVVKSVNPYSKLASTSSGRTYTYGELISTLPLPELMRLLVGVPARLRGIAQDLRYTSLATVSLVFDGDDGSIAHHWMYDLNAWSPIARISNPALWAEANVPAGRSALQAEIYFRGAPPAEGIVAGQALAGLQRSKIVTCGRAPAAVDVRFLQYGNVLHDSRRSETVPVLHQYLTHVGIHLAGRYALWDYSLIDDALRQGHAAGYRAHVAVRSRRQAPEHEELVDVLAATGAVVGQAARGEVHRLGLRHRTFHCWVLLPHQRVLLQLRSSAKPLYGGLFDASAAGHLSAGEAPLDGVRELYEELGLTVEPQELRRLGQYHDARVSPTAIDDEICDVYALSISEADLATISLDPREVSDVVSVSLNGLLRLVTGTERSITATSLSRRQDSIQMTKMQLVDHAAGYYTWVLKKLDAIVAEKL